MSMSGWRGMCRKPHSLLGLLIVFIAGCSENSEELEPDPRFRVDPYSGVTVPNVDFVEAMVLYRYGNAPGLGETFPDGLIRDGKSGRRHLLREIVGEKPSVLVFGSGSCSHLDLFVEEIPRLAEEYADMVDFHFVYIREAHPEGGFQPMIIRDGEPLVQESTPDATTLAERQAQALELSERFGNGVRVWVDGMDDELAVRWSAWPSRVFVLGPDGRVAYCGGPGPWYLRITKDAWHDPPPDNLEAEFRRKAFDDLSLEEWLGRLGRNRSS